MVNHNRDDKLDYCEADNVSISMDITIDLDLAGVILSANDDDDNNNDDSSDWDGSTHENDDAVD